MSDALDDTSGNSPVPSLDVSSGLAEARRALGNADPSASPTGAAAGPRYLQRVQTESRR